MSKLAEAEEQISNTDFEAYVGQIMADVHLAKCKTKNDVLCLCASDVAAGYLDEVEEAVRRFERALS